MEFGAKQVILVRDHSMKEELKREIGEAGLILTILQAKGMEFDDVVLWNFFETFRSAALVRKLELLYNEDAYAFDAKKYWVRIVLIILNHN